MHAQDRGWHQRDVSMQCVGVLRYATFSLNWACMNWTNSELNEFDLMMSVFQSVGLSLV